MKCYNCGERGHLATTCPNLCSRPPLPPSTKTTPNHKGGSMSAKATTTCFNCGQVGHFANRCPDQWQLSTPTQGNQNVARTPAYRKCYNCGRKGHFHNVCPNLRYCYDVTTIATSTPYRSANSTTTNAHHNSLRGWVNQVAMQGAHDVPGMETSTSLICSILLFTLVPWVVFFSTPRISGWDYC
jgi:hypothetical protein